MIMIRTYLNIADSQIFRHTRESGYPKKLKTMDSRLHGKDTKRRIYGSTTRHMAVRQARVSRMLVIPH